MKDELTIEEAFKKGIEFQKAGNFKGASHYYKAILGIMPKHAEANHNMGALAFGVGKISEALPFFKTALEANPDTEQFWLSYIETLIKLDEVTDAKNAISDAEMRDVSDKILGELKKKLIIKCESLRENFTVDPDPPIEKQDVLIKLYSAGSLNKAYAESKKLIKLFPKSPILFNITGVIYQAMGDYESSIEAFTTALNLNPAYPDAYNNMGLTLQMQGRLDQATDAFYSALRFQPQYSEAYNNLGNTLRIQGKLREAIEAFQNAVRIKPDYLAAFRNLIYIFVENGNFEKAIYTTNKALAIQPNTSSLYNDLGGILQRQGKLDEALAAYEQAIIINSNDPSAYNDMGVALNKKCRLDEAIDAFKKAISIKPDYSDAFWNLSGTAGTISDAKAWLERCLKSDNNYLKAKLNLAALKAYEGNKSNFDKLLRTDDYKNHPYMRSFSWVLNLPVLPELFFNRWALFDRIINISSKDRPFYEFGVWRGESFKYLIKTYGKGYGFDTFEGLPENWHQEKAGTYSSDKSVPDIEGGKFIAGKFEDTLPKFFSAKRPKASIINFDADLYSSTICALNHAKCVIDSNTILIFDEFIINENWEKDEYKALNEFCAQNNFSYEVLAISFFTKQVAVRIIR